MDDPETWEERLDGAVSKALREQERGKERRQRARDQVRLVLLPALEKFRDRLKRVHGIEVRLETEAPEWGLHVPGLEERSACVWWIERNGSFRRGETVAGKPAEPVECRLEPGRILEELTTWFVRVLETLDESDPEGEQAEALLRRELGRLQAR